MMQEPFDQLLPFKDIFARSLLGPGEIRNNKLSTSIIEFAYWMAAFADKVHILPTTPQHVSCTFTCPLDECSRCLLFSMKAAKVCLRRTKDASRPINLCAAILVLSAQSVLLP